MNVCVFVCVWSVTGYSFGDKLGPVNWGLLVQLGTKAVSPTGKKLILGSVVKVRVRLS